MDGEYSRGSRTKKSGFVFLIIGIVLVIIGGYVFLQYRAKGMVSPLPSQPSFEVIFSTPTVGITETPPTPSATPKGQKPSATTKPTAKPSATPTVKPSGKPSSTPTGKPSSTPKLTP